MNITFNAQQLRDAIGGGIAEWDTAYAGEIKKDSTYWFEADGMQAIFITKEAYTKAGTDEMPDFDKTILFTLNDSTADNYANKIEHYDTPRDISEVRDGAEIQQLTFTVPTYTGVDPWEQTSDIHFRLSNNQYNLFRVETKYNVGGTTTDIETNLYSLNEDGTDLAFLGQIYTTAGGYAIPFSALLPEGNELEIDASGGLHVYPAGDPGAEYWRLYFSTRQIVYPQDLYTAGIWVNHSMWKYDFRDMYSYDDDIVYGIKNGVRYPVEPATLKADNIGATILDSVMTYTLPYAELANVTALNGAWLTPADIDNNTLIAIHNSNGTWSTAVVYNNDRSGELLNLFVLTASDAAIDDTDWRKDDRIARGLEGAPLRNGHNLQYIQIDFNQWLNGGGIDPNVVTFGGDGNLGWLYTEVMPLPFVAFVEQTAPNTIQGGSFGTDSSVGQVFIDGVEVSPGDIVSWDDRTIVLSNAVMSGETVQVAVHGVWSNGYLAYSPWIGNVDADCRISGGGLLPLTAADVNGTDILPDMTVNTDNDVQFTGITLSTGDVVTIATAAGSASWTYDVPVPVPTTPFNMYLDYNDNMGGTHHFDAVIERTVQDNTALIVDGHKVVEIKDGFMYFLSPYMEVSGQFDEDAGTGFAYSKWLGFDGRHLTLDGSTLNFRNELDQVRSSVDLSQLDGFVKTSPSPLQTVQSDLAFAEGFKVFGTDSGQAIHELIGHNIYPGGQATEVGSEADYLTLNHSALGFDGTDQDWHINVNGHKGDGTAFTDKVAYVSDVEAVRALTLGAPVWLETPVPTSTDLPDTTDPTNPLWGAAGYVPTANYWGKTSDTNNIWLLRAGDTAWVMYDDNSIYATDTELAAVAATKLSVVTTDGTILGDGTPGNPLSYTGSSMDTTGFAHVMHRIHTDYGTSWVLAPVNAVQWLDEDSIDLSLVVGSQSIAFNDGSHFDWDNTTISFTDENNLVTQVYDSALPAGMRLLVDTISWSTAVTSTGGDVPAEWGQTRTLIQTDLGMTDFSTGFVEDNVPKYILNGVWTDVADAHASTVDNDSLVDGATVADALEELMSSIATVLNTSVIGSNDFGHDATAPEIDLFMQTTYGTPVLNWGFLDGHNGSIWVFTSGGWVQKIFPQVIGLAAPTVIGIAKLYNAMGTQVDGGITPAAVKAYTDLRELLANKAVDFSAVNDTKYPTTKAVVDYVASKAGKYQSKGTQVTANGWTYAWVCSIPTSLVFPTNIKVYVGRGSNNYGVIELTCSPYGGQWAQARTGALWNAGTYATFGDGKMAFLHCVDPEDPTMTRVYLRRTYLGVTAYYYIVVTAINSTIIVKDPVVFDDLADPSVLVACVDSGTTQNLLDAAYPTGAGDYIIKRAANGVLTAGTFGFYATSAAAQAASVGNTNLCICNAGT